nr:competence protein CoiA family protein [uncultured Psychroserpens sp.]
MKAIITIAKEKTNGIVKHISEVKNGLKCDCVCLECSFELIAANKGKKQTPHFRHQGNSNCNGSPETGMHLLAKKIIEESDYLNISWTNKFYYSCYITEKKLHDIIPDIQVKNGLNEIWVIEIAVTHKVDDLKLQKIKALNLNCLEIDLSSINKFISKEDLKKIIIDEVYNKKILNKALESSKIKSESTKKTQKESLFNLLNLILLIGLFFLGRYMLKKQ